MLELLRLRFKEEFSLPGEKKTSALSLTDSCHSTIHTLTVPLAGDTDILELKLDTEDEDEDVFLLSATLLL